MSVKCTERVVQVAFIYAQKDSFAHRYGILEICGAFAVGFRLIRPGRPIPARSLHPAGGCCGCFGGAGKLTSGFGRWLRALAAVCGLRGFGRWLRSAGAGPLRLFVPAGTIVFFSPVSPGGSGSGPGGIVRTLRLQLPATRIYIPRRADSVDRRTQKNL